MNCNYCGNELIQISFYFYKCEQHGKITILFEPVSDDYTNIYFVKDGYEICSGVDDEGTSFTTLNLYPKQIRDSPYAINGYDYGGNSKIILEYEGKLDINPYNFDACLDRLLRLKVFS